MKKNAGKMKKNVKNVTKTRKNVKNVFFSFRSETNDVVDIFVRTRTQTRTKRTRLHRAARNTAIDDKYLSP